jgi:hypothetical protein
VRLAGDQQDTLTQPPGRPLRGTAAGVALDTLLRKAHNKTSICGLATRGNVAGLEDFDASLPEDILHTFEDP